MIPKGARNKVMGTRPVSKPARGASLGREITTPDGGNEKQRERLGR
jgi:hypothetical protein